MPVPEAMPIPTTDRDLGEALADLARLLDPADLIHFRDTLKRARDKRQLGTVGLFCQVGPGRITDVTVETKLRAPREGAPQLRVNRAAFLRP